MGEKIGTRVCIGAARAGLGLLLFLVVAGSGTARAAEGWDRGTLAYDSPPGGEISPQMPDSAHLLPEENGGPSLVLRLSNRTQNEVRGALVYIGITDFEGRGVQDFTQRLDLSPGGSLHLGLKADNLAGRPGFYDVRVLMFDRGREFGRSEFSFGYAVDKLSIQPDREPNFDSFWRATLDSLRADPLRASLSLDSSRSTPEVTVHRVSYTSLHRVTVHGWYSRPAGNPRKLAALLVLPGYGMGQVQPPLWYAQRGWAALAIQVRGYGVDQAEYPGDNRRYMTLGIDSPEKYIYREIVCHCLRGLDFLACQAGVDTTRLGVVGGSQGGGLALLTAGLDRRVKVVAADVPFLTGFPLSMRMSGNPYRELAGYIEAHPAERSQVMRTVSYVDALNLAGRISAPTLLSVGLFDRTCPAPPIYGLYLRLRAADKKICIYPYLDHLEVGGRNAQEREQWLLRFLPPAPRPN